MKRRLGQFWVVGSLVLLLQGSLVPGASASGELPPLEVVPHLDLQRYLGKWYEVAAIPQSFQKNCVATTATYSLRSDGKIDVLNECRKFEFDGKLSRAHGKAWIPNPEQPAKLLVQFFWPFRGDYWVIELGDNYEYAVVGHPSRDYLWILSRTAQMDPLKIEEIYGRLSRVGYDLSRIQTTLQPGNGE
jgi:apolipoprotein D and lipocalin family protein